MQLIILQGIGLTGVMRAILLLGLLWYGLITLGLYAVAVVEGGWWRVATMAMLCVLAVALLLVLSPSAKAHSWYPAECCGGRDCKPVACDELTETKEGVKYRSYTFTGKEIRPSQDGGCHVCYWENTYGIQGWCVFVNPGS